MINPYKRSAVLHRPALRPAPGTHAFEVDSMVEVTEGNEDSDWAMWEDSVQQFESSGIAPLDPFDRVGRRDR
jgi:hypothetical protein